MNVTLPILAAHMIGDYVTQTDWMAETKFSNWKALTLHVAVYTAGFVPVVVLARLAVRPGFLFLGLIFVTHWITDCRRWAKGDKWPAKPILVDQSIHIATLAILAVAFGL
jgi:hypothetical protein